MVLDDAGTVLTIKVCGSVSPARWVRRRLPLPPGRRAGRPVLVRPASTSTSGATTLRLEAHLRIARNPEAVLPDITDPARLVLALLAGN